MVSMVSHIPTSPRFLSPDECHALFDRARQLARSDAPFRRLSTYGGARGGRLVLGINSMWTGNTRWAQNRISMAEDVSVTQLDVMHGGRFTTTQLDDVGLAWALHHAERQAEMSTQIDREGDQEVLPPETYLRPEIWSDATYHLDAEARADAIRTIVQAAEAAGLRAAGYCEVAAIGRAAVDERDARLEYYPFTRVQYSVSVRTPDGTGAGWAGMDHHDWTAIDAKALTQRALEKCLMSRNPVAIEPGRYTTIFEPQAVGDLLAPLFYPGTLGGVDQEHSVNGVDAPFGRSAREGVNASHGWIRFGERVWDERLSVSADPMDPLLGFPPFDIDGPERRVFKPVRLIHNGVLEALYYDDRRYAVRALGQLATRPNSMAFHVSVTGATASLDELVRHTERGLLVTRLNEVHGGGAAWLSSGVTRDGLWLIEQGKISKPCKNLHFSETVMGAMNRIEEIGVPTRIFRPMPAIFEDWGMAPIVVPALKIRDFNFTSLVDAV